MDAGSDFVQSRLVDPLGNALNTNIVIYSLVGVDIYFTERTCFIQIRYFGGMTPRRPLAGTGGVADVEGGKVHVPFARRDAKHSHV